MADSLDGKRVLVVDDEVDVGQMVGDMLPTCKVEVATTYESARERLGAGRYDVIIMDIMGVRGLDLLAEFAPRTGAPWIMLTAHALTPDSLLRSIRGRAALFLPKDELGGLDEYIRKVLLARESLWSWLFDRVAFGRHFGKAWSTLRAVAHEFAQASDATAAGPTTSPLGYLGSAARAAVSRNLASEDAEVRRYAVVALELIGGPDSAENLVRALDDPDAGVRAEAVSALVRLGPTARPALEAVRLTGGAGSRLADEALRRMGA